MTEDWLGRWQQGRIGWHQADGNPYLQRYWPGSQEGGAVLVPLCGKSVDMLWLAGQGLAVHGVELSDIAIEAFFAENDIGYTVNRNGRLPCYTAKTLPIKIYCGDYFDYRAEPAAALYDRGALATLPAAERPGYVQHTQSLLLPQACRMIITLEYDQEVVQGPPFSVLPEEMQKYWPDLRRVAAHNDIDDSPPKFRQAGLDEFIEAVWSSA